MRRAHFLLTSALTVALAARPAAQSATLFTFHSNAWLNLHHLLIKAAALDGAAPSALSGNDARVWAGGVEFYRRYAKRNLVSDEELVAIKGALRAAEGKAGLDGIAIDASVKATLERVMPIAQRHWWPAHDRANREWIAAARLLVDRHGAAIAQAAARTYGVTWPGEPFPVDASAAAGPVGAYATGTPTHIMMSSQDPSYRGYAALEMLFHEASHHFGVLYNGVHAAATEQQVSVPPQLSHAVLFYTAGELTRRELKAHGIDYVQYAMAGDLYTSLCGAGCREKIAAHWTPRLDGQRSVAEALSALVGAFK